MLTKNKKNNNSNPAAARVTETVNEKKEVSRTQQTRRLARGKNKFAVRQEKPSALSVQTATKSQKATASQKALASEKALAAERDFSSQTALSAESDARHGDRINQFLAPRATMRTAMRSRSSQNGEKPKREKSSPETKTKPPVHQRKGTRKNTILSQTAKNGATASAAAEPVARKRAAAEKATHPKGASPVPAGKLRVIPLGGIGEIGKNMTAIEYENDIVIIDVGVAFPDEDMLGIDLVIPDVSYLVKNAARVRGILITHGHEDHVGAIAYVLRQFSAPVYGTALSLGIIRGKLAENPPQIKPELHTVEAGDKVRLGALTAEFIHVNHSIADACAIALHTPLGIVYHSGDFKLDVSPMDGNLMDLVRIGELGKQGVALLLCESTNAERPGFTPSERSVGSSLERVFTQYEHQRLIVATFSSNVHRVQQIINTSVRHGRKVAVLGRSMVNILSAATELGYIDLPAGVLIDVADIKRYKPEQITLITTGSQGEPMSALYRIAFSESEKVKLTTSDVVVLSSSAIPGNEKLIGKIINALVHSGVKVVNDAVEAVHVSGHACREEIKLLMALLKPTYFIPIHGEYRHLYANKEIAEFMGIAPQNIFLSEIGRVLELDANGARFVGTVPSGKVLIDGSGVGDIGAVVLRDRKNLSEDGVVAVVASVALREGMILSGPDIVSRGFVYVKESEELMEQTRKIAVSSLTRLLEHRETDFAEIKNVLRDDIAKFIFKQTRRKPMILPIIMDI